MSYASAKVPFQSQTLGFAGRSQSAEVDLSAGRKAPPRPDGGDVVGLKQCLMLAHKEREVAELVW